METNQSLFAIVSRLSRRTPLGRPMPKGYYWGFCIDNGIVWVENPSFAEVLKKHGINVEVSL
jgi:hypothetical protein